MMMPDTGPGVAARRSSRTQEGREAGTRAAARRPSRLMRTILLPSLRLAWRAVQRRKSRSSQEFPVHDRQTSIGP